MVTPGTASGPDVSFTTLSRLDDRLWAAGADWRSAFETLHPAQQEALLRLNSVAHVVSSAAAMPPACETLDCDDTIIVVPPPEAQRPIERDIVIDAPPPNTCASRQTEVKGYSAFGQIITRSIDWMTWCISNSTLKFVSYDHGHDANAYGWGWHPDSCICQEDKVPAPPGEELHSFASEQTYSRVINVGGIGDWPESTTHNTEGYVRAGGLFNGTSHTIGW